MYVPTASRRRRFRKNNCRILAATNVLHMNHQVAFMAPTEILANQHFEKFKDWFGKTNVQVSS